jgi:CRISPR-associated protein Csd1
MLLQRLVEYSDRIPSTPVMYQKTHIRWLIELDYEGKLLGFMSTSGAGKGETRGKAFQAPHLGRSLDVRAKLLADNGEYVLGLARGSSDPWRVRQCHLAFRALAAEAAVTTGEITVRAVCKFYDTTDFSLLTYPEDLNPADLLTFRVEGVIPVELASIQRFWALHAGGAQAGTDQELYRCIVCGELKPTLRHLPFRIKQIPKGQFAGNTLISASSPSFQSYGLIDSLASPICSEDAEKFSKAANALLECDDTHLTIGSLAYIFWAREASLFPLVRFLSNPGRAEVEMLLDPNPAGRDSAWGRDDSAFYAAAFSASGARLAVRDWQETTVGEVKQSLARYFRLQRIAEPDGGRFQPMGIAHLAWATVPRLEEKPDYAKVFTNLPRVLVKCALEGKPLPVLLLYQVVTRVKAEGRVRRCHAVLIKMVLASQKDATCREKKGLEQLDPDNKDPAYMCGRIMALLWSLNYLSHGRRTTIGNYYGAASSAPASGLGLLLQGARAHLGRLPITKEGIYQEVLQKLAEVQSGLAAFPKTLTLRQQGLFALGCYHQRVQERVDIRELKPVLNSQETGEDHERHHYRCEQTA